MHHRFRRLSVAIAAALAVALGAMAAPAAGGDGWDAALAGAPSQPGKPAPAEHVVFIALDGFDSDYLGVAAMPHLEALAKRGSRSVSTGSMTSITNPSWSSIATGSWPETHGNTAYWFDAETNTARSQQRDLAVPTIAQAIREQGGTVMSAQWFILQNYGVTYGDPVGLYTQPGGDCARRTDDAVSVIHGEPVMSGGTSVQMADVPDLIAVYCDRLDALGHAEGDQSPQLPAALAEVDAQIGRLVQATKDAGIYGRTAFVVTGDHGMSTFTKGMRDELLAAISATGYRAEMLAAGQSPQPETDVVVVVGGVGSVHLIGDAAGDPAAAGAVESAIASLPHVAGIFDKAEQHAMHMSPKYGEFVVEPAPGWSLGATPAGSAGAHGTTRDLRVPLVISGAGVRPHAAPNDPRHIDIAPTIAALLGFDGPSGTDGRVLKESVRVR